MPNTHVTGVRGSVTNPRKQEIVANAMQRIMDGDTLDLIARSNGISTKTLHTWLMSLGDEYTQLRQTYVDSQLAECLEQIQSSEDQLQLGRAREATKYWQFYASTRDKRYSPKQEVQVTNVSISSSLARARERVIDVEVEGG